MTMKSLLLITLGLAWVSEAANVNDAWENLGVVRGFEGLHYKRSEEKAEMISKRDLRIKRHEAQLIAWSKNSKDPDALERQAKIMDAAREIEASAIERRKKRADAANGGSADMIDYYEAGVDIGYSANVSVGTPAQTFAQIPDTGSADLWVPSSTATDPGHNLFNSGASSTFQSTNQAFSDSYGLGKASGVVGRDTIQFAGFTVTNKTFGVANTLDSQFQNQPNDGLIGMSNSILSNMSAPTFFEELMTQKLINNAYFSVFLIRGISYTGAAQANVGGSTICLGCMAATTGVQTSGSMFYVPIPTNLFAFYEIQASSINLNGQTIASTSHYAIVDTGTTAIYLPVSVARNMMATVNGQLQSDGSYVVPVGSLTSSTVFSWTFSTGSINVNPQDLIAGYADRSGRYYYMNVFAASTSDGSGHQIAILGDAFIKNALTVFSYSQNGSPAVGFQQLNSLSGSNIGSVAVATATNNPGLPTTGTLRPTGTSPVTSSALSTSRASGKEKVQIKGVGSALMGLLGIALGMMAVL